MENKQTKENTKHTNIRLPIKTYNLIEKLGEKNERKVSQQIRYMLEEYIKIKEIEKE